MCLFAHTDGGYRGFAGRPGVGLYVYPGTKHRSGCDVRTTLSQTNYDRAAGAHT